MGIPLTIFTSTYNRAHTLSRTYRSLCCQTSHDFSWLIVDDGSTDGTEELVREWQKENIIPIDYIYNENGGLYTGYNVAYERIQTELSVCIDSDDYMPEDAVEKILNCWQKRGSEHYAGIVGLDYTPEGTPIGGRFPVKLKEVYFPELGWKYHHYGDIKPVLRTDLMKQVSPQEGFLGEKNFNPIYMILQVVDRYPLLVLNENLCFVEYQDRDSMSRGIYKQYVNSPRSFAKLRCLEMTLQHTPFRRKFTVAAHYVASCLLAKEPFLLWQSPRKMLTLAAIPLGLLIYGIISYKTRLHV